MKNETRDVDFDKVVEHLQKEYGWNLSLLPNSESGEALVDYTIKSIKDLLINSPQHCQFEEAMKREMAHHWERWGDESGTPPHHFNMVLGFINGKLAKAIWEKDIEKFEHHLLTIAAVAGTAHHYLKGNSEVKDWFEKKDL